MTPPIPDWLHTFRLDGYRSIYEYSPHESRVFGTESLFGDWNGRLLVMAKDFACSRLIEERLARGERAFSHDPNLKTNKALRSFVDSHTTSQDPTTCGVLYGSALAGILRDDGKMSGTLPHRKSALDFGTRVLRFTIDCMPGLQTIVCMGEEAWLCTTSALGIARAWRECRDDGVVCSAGGYALIAAFHPAARISNVRHRQAWSLVPSN